MRAQSFISKCYFKKKDEFTLLYTVYIYCNIVQNTEFIYGVSVFHNLLVSHLLYQIKSAVFLSTNAIVDSYLRLQLHVLEHHLGLLIRVVYERANIKRSLISNRQYDITA